MPELTPSQKNLLSTVDKACRELRPSEEKTWMEGKFNWQRVKILAKYRLLGMHVEKKYGGMGLNMLDYCLMLMRIGEEGTSLRTFFSVHSSVGNNVINDFGNEEQKKKYLPKTCTGEWLCGFALTEPGAGSDPGAMQTTFLEKGGKFILNGQKKWIGNSNLGRVFTTFAKDSSGKISAFIIDSKFEGYSSEPITTLVGLRNHDLGTITFKNCQVPKENLLGEKGEGLHLAYTALINGRLSVAAGSIGIMQDCINEAVSYAKERKQHGKEIGKHQLIQRHLARMATFLEASRAIVTAAAEAKVAFDEDRENETLRMKADDLAAKAKYFSSNASFEAVNSAVQIFGGNGYDLKYRVARHYCDDRVPMIYEGSNEIMELKIAMDLLGKEYAAFR